MEHSELKGRLEAPSTMPSMTDILAIGFRQKKLIVSIFCAVFLATLILAISRPTVYEAEMKLLVTRDRADAMVTPGKETPVLQMANIGEAEIQSEANLLRARDLLEKVVVACRLDEKEERPLWRRSLDAARGKRFTEAEANKLRVASALQRLEDELIVESLRKTNLISVRYLAHDPETATDVLNTLGNAFLEKHLALRRNAGAFEFFQEQTKTFRTLLTKAESELAAMGSESGVVAAQLEKELAVRKVADLEGSLRETETAIAATKRRVRTLGTELAAVPARQTTSLRAFDNAFLLEKMRVALLDLELKRTELLTKFEPTYRLVQEIDQQIAQTKAALADAETMQLRDETTDRDPTHDLLRAEVARANTDLATLQGRAEATREQLRTYRAEARQLNEQALQEQELIRTAKAEEERYLLYLNKQEEERISNALDEQRIANVVVAETPAVRERSSRLLILLLGTVLAGATSVSVAWLNDHLNPSFRTPREVEEYLDCPVLASMPRAKE